MKAKILKILRETKGFVSGQQLCTIMGVSRTAVWKVIKQLQSEGYDIESVHNKGYCLKETPDVISGSEIASLLPENSLFKNIHYKQEVTSTNDVAKLLAEQGAQSGTVVLAHNQSQGKGRRGRSWVSEPGNNLTMSFILRPDILPEKASMLTLVAAMAVADAVKEFGAQAGIKWPNDIVVDGKKICGILTEMSSQMTSINYVVIGIGINVHQTTFDLEVAKVATSLDLILNTKVSRSHLAAKVLSHFEYYYNQFLEAGDLSLVKDSYNQMLVSKGKEVRIIREQETKTGLSGGIDKDGALEVEIQGQKEKIIFGEVSVRGIEGYI